MDDAQDAGARDVNLGDVVEDTANALDTLTLTVQRLQAAIDAHRACVHQPREGELSHGTDNL
jgi:hypothetical protein